MLALRARRRALAGGCAAFVLALHLAALDAAAGIEGRRGTVRPPQLAPLELVAVASPPLPDDRRVALTPKPGPAPAVGGTVAARAEPTVAAALPDAFLTRAGVDEPAQPRLGWTLDAEALEALGLARLVCDLWTDAAGAIVAVRIVGLEPQALQPLVPQIEARLAATPMQPALKEGRAVAYRQRIELGIAPSRPAG